MSQIKRKILIIIPVSVLIVFILLIPTLERNVLYYPNYSVEAEYYLTHSTNEDFEFIEITNEDLTFSGWIHFAKSGSTKTIIYFGGNGESSAVTQSNHDIDGMWNIFNDYNLIMIDYPGYGLSEGKPTKEQILLMSECVMDYVKSDNRLNGRIVVMGYSLGTGVATFIASKSDVSGLILLAPYDEMRNVYNSYINIFHGPLSYSIHENYTPSIYAKNIDCDVLIVASTDDDVIPWELSKKLSESFNTGISMITINGNTHADLIYNQTLSESIKDFLSCES